MPSGDRIQTGSEQIPMGSMRIEDSFCPSLSPIDELVICSYVAYITQYIEDLEAESLCANSKLNSRSNRRALLFGPNLKSEV